MNSTAVPSSSSRAWAPAVSALRQNASSTANLRPRPISRTTALPATPVPPLSSPDAAWPQVSSRMFSTELQKRPAWAAVVPLLQASKTEPRWERAALSSHDMAVRLAADGTGSPELVFRFVLVAPCEVAEPGTLPRLERLHRRKTGGGGAVVFLLAPSSRTSQDGMAAHQQLQQSLVDAKIYLPTILLTSLDLLPETLAAFCSHSVTAACSSLSFPTTLREERRRLLRYGTASHQTLPDAALGRLLSRTEAFVAESAETRERPGIRLADVAAYCRMAAGDKARLEEALGPDQADGVLQFWENRP